jgi:hypothetical protein
VSVGRGEGGKLSVVSCQRGSTERRGGALSICSFAAREIENEDVSDG